VLTRQSPANAAKYGQCLPHTLVHLGLVSIYTHTALCGDGLSAGPAEGLSLCCPCSQSPPDSQQHQKGRLHAWPSYVSQYICILSSCSVLLVSFHSLVDWPCNCSIVCRVSKLCSGRGFDKR